MVGSDWGVTLQAWQPSQVYGHCPRFWQQSLAWGHWQASHQLYAGLWAFAVAWADKSWP